MEYHTEYQSLRVIARDTGRLDRDETTSLSDAFLQSLFC